MTEAYTKIIKLYDLNNDKSIIKVASKDIREYNKNPSPTNLKYLNEDYDEIRDTLTDLEGENEEGPNKGKFFKYIYELRELKNKLNNILGKKNKEDPREKAQMNNVNNYLKVINFDNDNFISHQANKAIDEYKKNPTETNYNKLYKIEDELRNVYTNLNKFDNYKTIKGKFIKTLNELSDIHAVIRAIFKEHHLSQFKEEKLNCFSVHYKMKNGKDAVKYIHFDKAHPMKQMSIGGENINDIIKAFNVKRF